MTLLAPVALIGCYLLLRHRLAAPTLTLAAIGALGMADEEQPVPPEGRTTWHIGGSGGAYRPACGPRHRFGTVSAGVQYREPLSPDLDLLVEGHLVAGLDEYPDFGREVIVYNAFVGFRPMIGAESYAVEGVVGASVGRLYTWGGQQAFLPALRFRAGPREVASFNLRVGDDLYGAMPAGYFQMSLGVGLPPKPHAAWNHPKLEIGVSDLGLLGGLSLPLGSQLSLDLLGLYGDDDAQRLSAALRFRPRQRR